MSRIDDDALSHLEVALSTAAASLLADLLHSDRYRRRAAVSTLARHLVERMRCFEIAMVEECQSDQPSLFADLPMSGIHHYIANRIAKGEPPVRVRQRIAARDLYPARDISWRAALKRQSKPPTAD